MIRRNLVHGAVGAAVLLLSACGGGSGEDLLTFPPPSSVVPVGDTVVLTASGRLVSFNRAAPATAVGSVAVTGLAAGETLLGIDYRPADGKLYALGSSGAVYVVAPATGVATLSARLRPTSGDDAPFVALSGDHFGVDFNPAADRLRVVSNTGQDLRINVDTGDAITDGTITAPAGISASISAVAYTNSFAGTVTTQLYDIDAASGLLHLQDPPNNGTLGAGRPLGVTASAVNGFDIDARTNQGYAVLTVGGTTSLYNINLATGAATLVASGPVAGGEPVRGLALAAPAVPTAIGLTADNRLVGFNLATPGSLTSMVSISGLGSGEQILGIDIRPRNGRLYALSSLARLYTVDPVTGTATFVAALSADPGDATLPYAGLASTVLSVDFNPVADRLRVVSDNGQNLRINVDTGATITDGVTNRAGTPASVIAAAYTSSFDGTRSTALYDIDDRSDVLALQSPPNDGTLVDVGPLGVAVSTTTRAAFDIGGGDNGLALAALRTGALGPMSLYSVSLTTGTATLYKGLSAGSAQIGGALGPALIDLAIRF